MILTSLVIYGQVKLSKERKNNYIKYHRRSFQHMFHLLEDIVKLFLCNFYYYTFFFCSFTYSIFNKSSFHMSFETKSCTLPVHVFRLGTVLQNPLCHSATVHWTMSFFCALQVQQNVVTDAVKYAEITSTRITKAE